MIGVADSELHRLVGRLEGTLGGIRATLDRVDKRSAARDVKIDEMADRLGSLERQSKTTEIITQEFNALQQAIRDGKKIGKGITIGVGLAAGAGGATIIALFKNVWVSIFGA